MDPIDSGSVEEAHAQAAAGAAAPAPVGKEPAPAPSTYRRFPMAFNSDDDTDSDSSDVVGFATRHSLNLNLDKDKVGRGPEKKLAHDLGDPKKKRSADVGVGLANSSSDKDFSSLKVSPKVLEGLKSCGFSKPSPIQVLAIPMGRLGRDMILQAKSGTGKTVVFAINALEKVDVNVPKIQVLVVSPTREIAFQSAQVIREIGAKIDGLRTSIFIGGMPIESDVELMKESHIVVGTPGRLVHLLREFEMDISALKVFVQDEVDKLLEYAFFDDLQYMYEKLPKEHCQVIVSSATYAKGIDDLIAKSMTDPIRVQLDRHAPILEAVEQYAVDIKGVYSFKPREGQTVITDEQVYQLKKRAIKDLIMLPCFKQVIIFVNVQARAERFFCELLDEKIDLIYLGSSMVQKDRIKNFTQFQQGRSRIMVATDIAARGLDFENVDLVINYELPMDIETFIHRMGRTGRFGTFGTNIVLFGFESEKRALEDFQSKLPTLKIYYVEDNETFMKIGAMEAEKKNLKLLEKKQRAEKDNAMVLLSEKHLPSLGEIVDGMVSGQLPLEKCHLVTYPMHMPFDRLVTREESRKKIHQFLTEIEREEISKYETRKQVRDLRNRRAEVSKPAPALGSDEEK